MIVCIDIKYSVIIPVYNAERTICRCLDSLLCQLRDDVELIAVNDGSSDNSLSLLREYEEKHDNFFLVNQENQGVSAARNSGIKKARGEYITFVDSDDYVADSYFDAFDSELGENKYDYVIFPAYIGSGESFSLLININEPFSSGNRDEIYSRISQLMCNKFINAPVARLFRRELISSADISFPVDKSIGEDRIFNMEFALLISSMKLSTSPIYYICTENENSLSRKITDDVETKISAVRADIGAMIDNSDLDDGNKKKLICALNFELYSEIYSNAKRDRISKKRRRERLRKIRSSSRELSRKKLPYPDTRYCKIICIPIRLRLTYVIDLVSWKLAR